MNDKDVTFSNKRTHCPECGSSDGLAEIDTYKGFDVSNQGFYKCHSCGAVKSPKTEKIRLSDNNYKPIQKIINTAVNDSEKRNIIDKAFKISNDNLHNNNLVNFILSLVNDAKRKDTIRQQIINMLVRTDKAYNAVFWYKDIDGNLTHCKAIPYGTDGKRLKDSDSTIKIGETYYAAYSGLCINNNSNPPFYETLSSKKGFNTNGIFNFDKLKSKDYDRIVIVESEKSTVLIQLLIDNICFIPSSGSNALNQEKIDIIKLYSENKEIGILFDNDEGGIKSADKYANEYNLVNYTNKFAELTKGKPKGYDIGDYAIDNFNVPNFKLFDNFEQTKIKQKLSEKSNKSKSKHYELMIEFINSNYQIKYNLLKERFELADKRDNELSNHRILTDFDTNTMIHKMKLIGLNITKVDLLQFIESDNTEKYDPFHDYINSLPKYDKKLNHNYIQDIADLITVDESALDLWNIYFKHWFIGYYANASGYAFAPFILTFIGAEQIGKSYFSELIVPKSLRNEYKTKINFKHLNNDTYLKACNHIILEADELEYLPKNEQGTLKSFLTDGNYNFRQSYGHFARQFRRRASFLGSANTSTILADPTSTRRFPTVEVKDINFKPLEENEYLLNNAFAQAKFEYDTGFNIFFDTETVKKMQLYNERFRDVGYYESILNEELYLIENHSNGIATRQLYLMIKKMYPDLRPTETVNTNKYLTKMGAFQKTVKKNGSTQRLWNVDFKNKVNLAYASQQSSYFDN